MKPPKRQRPRRRCKKKGLYRGGGGGPIDQRPKRFFVAYELFKTVCKTPPMNDIKRKIGFLAATFAATVVAMAIQKPLFLAKYALRQGFGAAEWWQVIWHGLTLDMTVAGYVTALPIVVVLLSLWVRLPERIMQQVFMVYFASYRSARRPSSAVDMGLYEHWGFRIDATILTYLSDPKEALANVDWQTGVRQTLLFAVYATALIWLYRGGVVRLFDGSSLKLASGPGVEFGPAAAGWSGFSGHTRRHRGFGSQHLESLSRTPHAAESCRRKPRILVSVEPGKGA